MKQDVPTSGRAARRHSMIVAKAYLSVAIEESNAGWVDEWGKKLLWLERNRDWLESLRSRARAWGEQFDWKNIAEEYRAAYAEVLGR